MTTLAQHLLFDAALALPDPSGRPYWMPAEEAGPGWKIWRSGAFPTRQDKALTEEKPDVQ